MIKGSVKAAKFARLVLAFAMSASLACGVAPMAFAKAGAAAQIGNTQYESLDDALAVASESGKATQITLLDDANGRHFIEDGMDVEIDLNGYEIANDTVPLAVYGGSLELTGEGAVKETEPKYASVAVEGNGASVDVGEDVELEGWSGLMVDKNADKDVNVQIAGKVNAVKDKNGDVGHGVYVNCDSRNTGKRAPQITLTETSEVKSAGNGIYAAGYAQWSLSGSVVAGADALSVKSGALTIEDGSYRSKGAYHATPATNNNGAESTGAALSITSNREYAGKIDVVVNGGVFKSENGNAVYEGIAADKGGKAAAKESEARITICGGEFLAAKDAKQFAITAASEKVVELAEMFVEKNVPDEPDAPDAPDAPDEPDEPDTLDEPDEPDTLDESDEEVANGL